MNESQQRQLESVISTATSGSCQIASTQAISGGCIHETFRLNAADGRRFMIKMNREPSAEMFTTERAAIELLAASSPVPRVPQMIAHGVFNDGRTAFLIMEWIDTGNRSRDFIERFGRELAALHRSASQQAEKIDRFGFPHNNFIGSTPQLNGWRDDWAEFWCENRLKYQFQLACDNGYGAAFSARKIEPFLLRASELIAETGAELPSLIHGDLWSGNYLVDERGAPVLIDPAAYYANREAEFGMTILFGGFDRRFYEAYHEVYPLQAGFQDRFEIYKLYHLLNHLNLFGTSYLAGCVSIVNRFS